MVIMQQHRNSSSSKRTNRLGKTISNVFNLKRLRYSSCRKNNHVAAEESGSHIYDSSSIYQEDSSSSSLTHHLHEEDASNNAPVLIQEQGDNSVEVISQHSSTASLSLCNQQEEREEQQLQQGAEAVEEGEEDNVEVEWEEEENNFGFRLSMVGLNTNSHVGVVQNRASSVAVTSDDDDELRSDLYSSPLDSLRNQIGESIPQISADMLSWAIINALNSTTSSTNDQFMSLTNTSFRNCRKSSSITSKQQQVEINAIQQVIEWRAKQQQRHHHRHHSYDVDVGENKTEEHDYDDQASLSSTSDHDTLDFMQKILNAILALHIQNCRGTSLSSPSQNDEDLLLSADDVCRILVNVACTLGMTVKVSPDHYANQHNLIVI